MKQCLWDVARLIVGTLVSLSGCAGTNFQRPLDTELVLGRTTYQEVVALLGPSGTDGKVTRDDRTFVVRSYGYVQTQFAAAVAGRAVYPSRFAQFIFFDEILVGYLFVSSFEGDHTDFDEGKIALVKKGESRRENVIQIMGRPSGHSIYPLAKEKEQEIIVYEYRHQRPGGRYRKSVMFTIGADAQVQDVQFTSSGNP